MLDLFPSVHRPLVLYVVIIMDLFAVNGFV